MKANFNVYFTSHCAWQWFLDCFLEILCYGSPHTCDGDIAYEAGKQITLLLEHNCTQHDPECSWDNRPNVVEILTTLTKMSPLISWSLLSTIREEEVIEGVHSLFCSLANNKTVSTLITVTTCKLLGGISAIRPFIAE